METKLIKCLSCMRKRIFDARNHNIVCALDQTGNVFIKKRHGGYVSITGSDFSVNCDNCGTPVYRKQLSPQWETIILMESVFMLEGTICGTA